MAKDARVMFFLVTLLVCSLLLLPAVMSVGFGNPPSNREIVFRSGTEVRIPFLIINGDNLRVTASTIQSNDPATLGTLDDDNMMEYVSINDPAPGTGPRAIEVVFRFPEHEMRPGTYPIDIFATDYAGGSDGSTITAIATVKMRLTVWVLSPEPLVRVLGVSAPSIAEGLHANVTVGYVSRTVQDLAVVTSVRVLDASGATLATASAPSRILPSGQSTSESIMVPTENLPGGDYDMYATIAYAGTTAEGGPAILKIGTLHVDIPAYTTEFTYNTTNRFRFTVANQWNRALREVYAVVNSGMQQKKTASLDIPPFGLTEYEVYFDRDEQLLPGPATVDVVVSFRDYNTTSAQYELRTEPFALPITVLPPPLEERPAMTLTAVLLWGLGFVVLALIVMIVILLRRRKEPPVAAQASTTTVALPPQNSG